MPPDSHYQVELTNPEKASVNKTYGADSQPNIFKSDSFGGKINCSYPYYGNNVRRKGRREERNEKNGRNSEPKSEHKIRCLRRTVPLTIELIIILTI